MFGANRAAAAPDFDVARNAAAALAAYAARAAARAAYAIADPETTAADAASSIEAASAVEIAVVGDSDACWSALDADCQFLQADERPGRAIQRLSSQPLWPAERPKGWNDAWSHAKTRLRALDDRASYQVWIDWYERRITGHDAAFDIPGDDDRAEDKAIILRLADATDEEFWDKRSVYVNTTLQQWIDEARERGVKRLPPLADDDFKPNPAAIVFGHDEAGRIRVDPAAGVDALRTDAEAADRHAEAMYEARAILDRYRMSNAAAGVVALLERYVQAGGDSLPSLRPSLFVQRGERLRQFITANSGDNRKALLDPASEEVVLDLQGWQSAHNMVVGLDPFLSRMESAIPGPDVKPAFIESSEVVAIAAEADAAGILSEGTREIMVEAASLAPDVPDAQNRRSVWTAEMMTNFAGETVAIVAKYPWQAGAVVVGVKLVGAAGLLPLAIAVADFAKKREKNLLKSLERYPACQAILRDIVSGIMPEDGQGG